MRAKLVNRLAAFLLIGGFGLALLDAGASHEAASGLQRRLADNPDLSVAVIEAEPIAGRITLRGIRARRGAATLSIQTLRVPAPGLAFGMIGTAAAANADTPPPSSTASAENVVIVDGTTTFRIKRIDLTGTSLTSADLAALLDAKGTDGLDVRLKKLTASAIVIPEILSDDTTAGSERHATINQVLLSSVTNGKIGLGSVAGVSFAFKDGDQTTNGTTGAMQASSVDLPQIVHVLGSVRTDDNEKILPLYDSLIVNAIKITSAESTTTLGLLKETDLKARALKNDIFASGLAGKVGPDADSGTQAKILDDLAHSFEVGAIEATDLKSEGKGAGGLSLARVFLNEAGGGKIGTAGLRDFHFEGNGQTLSIASIDLGRLTLPAGAMPLDSTAAAAMAPPGKIDISHMDIAAIPTGEENVPANLVTFKVGHVGFAGEGLPGEIPTKAALTIDNVAFDLPPSYTSAKPLYDMGYRHLDLSSALATTYDPGTQDLKVDTWTVNGVSMGTVGLGLHLANVGKGVMSPNPDVVKVTALAILAKGIDLTVENSGLIEKVLQWKAGTDGITVAEERDQGVDFFTNALPMIANGSPKAKAIGAAIAKFIADPKTLHISIASQTGLGVAAAALVGTPDVLLDTLDVKATANE